MRSACCLVILAIVQAATQVAAQSTLDSLLTVLPSQSGAARVLTLGEIQWELGFIDPPKAGKYGEEAMRIAEMSKDSSLIATAANDLAITEYRLGHYPRSIVLNTRALRIRTAAGDSVGMAASHSKLGVAYTEVLSFDSALVHDYAAERSYMARGELVHAAQVRGNLGRLYQQEGDLDAAERVARETVDMLTGTNEPYAEATALGQLAHILVDRKDMDATLQVAERAVKLYRQLDAKAEIASLANILGIAYRRKGDDASGLKYYREALDMSKAIGDRNGETVYLANIANVLSDDGRTAEALPLYEASIELARKEGYPDQLMTSLDGYVNTLEKAGRKGDALGPLRELLALRDSLYRTERIEALSDMQVKYETQRTEKELLEQRQRNLEQRARIDRQRLWIGAISLGVLVVALGAWLVIMRQRARANVMRPCSRNANGGLKR
jgi:tetratricopeptide (TPR) repeat protein